MKIIKEKRKKQFWTGLLYLTLVVLTSGCGSRTGDETMEEEKAVSTPRDMCIGEKASDENVECEEEETQMITGAETVAMDVDSDAVSLETASLAMEKYIKNFYVVAEDGTGAIAGEQFWPRAEILEIVVDAYEKTGEVEYMELFDQMYAGFLKDYKEEWSFNDYNDDIMWMTIACARAYQAGGKEEYLQQARHHFDLVYERAWSEDLGGGLFWRTENTTKNSCINGPAAIAACLLYQATGEQSYLDKAVAVYGWQSENLLGSTGAVYDAWDLENGINEWCSTYNQGTFIGASVYLYEALGEEDYLQNAILAADYARDEMYGGGVINTEDEGNDLPGFKGIFARWMGKLIYECDQEQYLPWMEKNARTAWGNRNSKDIMWTKWADKTQDTFYTAWGCSAGVALLWNCLPPAQQK
ncbi:MAG: glycoside hydrolase family 76 protein [Lachnospiraceae bacterium]|nr:glycoside hydrolase family 76 protein [Lachnospiraceae bacterium]MCI9097508.1 glycoside hydrolase family 76 protein [Lachnospiraceae bacterium]MCI9202414.1 glycoside hydrolase family 76 protein [Lachnospiraceae bacterium]